jgi:hypothetical protein
MPSKLTYKLKLRDIIPKGKIKPADKKELREELGELLYDMVLQYVSEAKSPVKRERTDFPELNKDYAKAKSKVAIGKANLELTGAMLDAVQVKTTNQSIEIGIFNDKGQADKADGHCNHSGRSKLPRRRFIPAEGQGFKKDIMDELKELAEGYVDGEE